MDINSFLEHHGISQNPFAAEEARLDPVLSRLGGRGPQHPDFAKIAGEVNRPSTAVVFGEKGSGKTTIRLRIAERIAAHNADHPEDRQLLVPYDELNPILDNLQRAGKQNPKKLLKDLRLADHQDAIISIAVSRLINGLLEEGNDEDRAAVPGDLRQRLRKMPREARLDLALLAMLYDRPPSGVPTERFARLTRLLGVRRVIAPMPLVLWLGMLLLATAMGFAITGWFMADPAAEPPVPAPLWVTLTQWATLIAGALSLGYWLVRQGMVWYLARALAGQVPSTGRSAGELREMLLRWKPSELARRPLPTRHGPGEPDSDSRYQLTRRLIEAIRPLGYTGITVLVDRIDEPTIINADPEKMKALVWPLFDNKFLKQNDLGVKLLLPLELSRMVRQQSSEWFQAARLDKQNLIESLSWTGTTLYDLCNRRLNACRPAEAEPITLADLFEDAVDAEELIKALDQMHQPRDAFKFLYAVIQEHCRIVPDDQADFRIARLTLESIRRHEAQRVQDFHRGLSPA